MFEFEDPPGGFPGFAQGDPHPPHAGVDHQLDRSAFALPGAFRVDGPGGFQINDREREAPRHRVGDLFLHHGAQQTHFGAAAAQLFRLVQRGDAEDPDARFQQRRDHDLRPHAVGVGLDHT